MFSFLKSFTPEVKKWIFPHQNEERLLDKLNSCDSETFSFELLDKSQIRSIHYLNNTTHFNSKLYEKFISSFKEIAPEKTVEQQNEGTSKKEAENFENENYFEYRVEEDDSLIGIALKFDINIHVLESINRISEGNIYPNQVIKIPKKEQKEQEIFEEEKKQVEDEKEESQEKSTNSPSQIGEVFDFRTIPKQHSIEIFKIPFYYCTSYGQIPGLFTLNPYLLMFDPDYVETKQQVGDMRVIKFQACIDLADINEAFIVTLPSKYCESYTEDKLEFTKDFYLQIIVRDIGIVNIEKSKHASRLFKLRQQQKGFATLFFKLFEKSEIGGEMKNIEKLEKIRGFLSKLHSNIEERKKEMVSLTEESQSSSTMIPFYDLFYDQIKDIMKEERQAFDKNEEQFESASAMLTSVTGPLNNEIFKALPHYLPEMSHQSNIIDKEQFVQIIHNLPSFVKLRSWKLVYANWKDGMSINTLFRNCQNMDENILIIKDFDGYVFGGFCSQTWEINNKFYGTGETFLFTFKNQKRIKVFNWTTLNYDIMFSNLDSLALGCGEKFGLYVNKELLKGRSYPSETFNNEVLSKENDFEIQYLEIWSLDENLEG